MKENIKINAMRMIVGILSLICLFDMPYGYYQLYRFIAMFTFLILANSEKNNKQWKAIWMFSALLVQPFFKIPLGREIWNVIDIIWSLLLIIPVYQNKK